MKMMLVLKKVNLFRPASGWLFYFTLIFGFLDGHAGLFDHQQLYGNYGVDIANNGGYCFFFKFVYMIFFFTFWLFKTMTIWIMVVIILFVSFY